MKYVSVDIETTGLDAVKNDILEVGLIIEDTATKAPYDDCPKLRFWIDKEFYRGNPYALAMNAPILQKICDLRRENSKRLVQPDDAFTRIANFLRPHFANGQIFDKQIVVAGKNYQGFDRAFLSRLKGFENIPFSHRVIDPGSIFINWQKDEVPPGLIDCKKRVGIEGAIKHDTLADAWDVIMVLRSQY